MAICHRDDRFEDVKLQSAVTARLFACEQQVIHHNQRTKENGKVDGRFRCRPSISRRKTAKFQKASFTGVLINANYSLINPLFCSLRQL